MNPYYVAYARAHGYTPDAMLSADYVLWPGGRMCGFILWMRDRWDEWRKLVGRRPLDILSDEDRAAFGAWVANYPEIPDGSKQAERLTTRGEG